MDLASQTTVTDFGDSQIAELVLRLRLALLWRERDVAADLANRLQPVAHLVRVSGFTGSIARLIGLRWMLDGGAERARTALELAVRACAKIQFRDELAVARLNRAELLLAQYPRGGWPGACGGDGRCGLGKMGPGPIRPEITTLTFGTLRRCEFEAAYADKLDSAVFDGYIKGLHEAGWRGRIGLVRFGYTAAIALRWTGLAGILHMRVHGAELARTLAIRWSTS